jgi:hypothetical protein
LLLALATVVLSACGTGISLEPLADPAESVGDASDAGDQVSTADSGANGDGSLSERATDFDARAEESLGSDRGTDSSADADSDRERDVAADNTADRSADSAIDAGVEASTDQADDATARPDISVDAAADASDAPPPPSDASLDGAGIPGDADAAEGCSVGCGMDTDCYVDANALPGGDGSKQAPFKTISACVEAHTRSPGRARTAHVAAGTYDESLGEHFPLVLRGLSLEGAGADQTFIRGSGVFDHTAEQGPMNSVYMVTLAVGDRVLPTHLSGFSVRPIPLVPMHGYHGIFCDRGSATGEVASPAGQTFVDRIKVGPGFDTAVLAVTSTNPSVTGCNLVVTRSSFTGGWMGIESIACDDIAPPGRVVLEVGNDDPTSGNTFSWMQAQEWLGYDLRVGGCVTLTSLQYNTFTDSTIAVELGGEPPPPNGPRRPLVVRHNTFERMSDQGLVVAWALGYVEEISDNRFSAISRPADPNFALALNLVSGDVGKLRRNVFVGNDIGVSLGSDIVDFGRPDDPGGNVFHCNSAIGASGSDVAYYPAQTLPDGGAPTLHFAGNSWDYLPPRTGDETAPNGIEFRFTPAAPAVLDVSGATLVTTPCPAGHIP